MPNSITISCGKEFYGFITLLTSVFSSSQSLGVITIICCLTSTSTCFPPPFPSIQLQRYLQESVPLCQPPSLTCFKMGMEEEHFYAVFQETAAEDGAVRSYALPKGSALMQSCAAGQQKPQKCILLMHSACSVSPSPAKSSWEGEDKRKSFCRKLQWGIAGTFCKCKLPERNNFIFPP